MNKLLSILYVDDEPINLQLFKINLGEKYRIFTANGATEALKVLEENKSIINAVVSDFRMPKINGVELINMAKIKYPLLNYYMLTGFETTEEIAEALSNGTIKKCFRKPFNVVEIDYEMNALKENDAL